MIVRPASKVDAAAVTAIWNGYIRDTFVTFNAQEKVADTVARDIAMRLADGKPFFVAEEKRQILGFATYVQFRSGVGYAHTMEHTILLSAEARGRGVGRALMRALEDHARAAGVHSLFGGVSALNPEGAAFHEALGFVRVATLSEVGWKAGRWIDLDLFQKRL